MPLFASYPGWQRNSVTWLFCLKFPGHSQFFFNWFSAADPTKFVTIWSINLKINQSTATLAEIRMWHANELSSVISSHFKRCVIL